MESTDHRRQHVTVLWMVIVVWAIQIGWHYTDEMTTILRSVSIAKFDSGDFVAAFADGGYERGGRKTLAIQAVPEPNYGELCFGVLAVFLAATVRKRG